MRHLTLVLLQLCAPPARAQDLFELQVFPYQGVGPGETAIALFTNAVPTGTVLGPAGEGEWFDLSGLVDWKVAGVLELCAEYYSLGGRR